jgi:hypothetical protein
MSRIKISLSEKKDNTHKTFEGFHREYLSPRGKKLLKEWKKIDHLCQNSDKITYIIRKRNNEGLPVEYEIIYKVRSVIGVEGPSYEDTGSEEDHENREPRKPIYGDEHRMSIILPQNYPSAFGGNPEFKMISDTWHPNIRATGKFKGRICLNNRDLGVGVGLDERIIRVGKYLQYQIYWANESYPWPEDKAVAEWVREEAEPNKWVNLKEGIYTDYSTLYKTDKLADARELNIKKDKDLSDSGDNNLTIKI